MMCHPAPRPGYHLTFLPISVIMPTLPLQLSAASGMVSNWFFGVKHICFLRTSDNFLHTLPTQSC